MIVSFIVGRNVVRALLVLGAGSAVPAAGACAEPFYDSDLGVEGVAVDEGALAGTWALKGNGVDQAETAIGKVDTGGRSFYLSKRTFNVDTKVYDETLTVCAVENFETAGLQTTNNPAAIDAIPAIPTTVTVDHATGAYTRATFREYWAIDGLDDDDDLPTDPDDDVYYDSDDDDHPGATVFTQGLVPDGEVYVAQRKTVSATGVVRGVDQSFGLLASVKEGITLAANNDFLLTEADRVPHPDPKESWWMEIRLADDAGCDDVEDARDSDDLPLRRPF
ncbi:MAG: hypothetical protein Q8O67_15885 [Deltaproteobacteria bacterium]|nr:hypothetical protein [Deltaproteobacteria bacterium]